jgi:putative oxidoreductase
MYSFFTRFYNGLIALGDFFQPFLLLCMRLYWGIGFYKTGMGKFANHPGIVTYFNSLHIPFPELNAYLVAGFETIGGISLIIGLGARLFSIPLICILSTAYATAHHAALVTMFQDPATFISQPPFNFLVTCLIVFCFGPGLFSIDRLLTPRMPFKR